MPEDNSPSLEDQVNTVLTQIQSGAAPADDTDPAILFAANAEKRRRDTQSSYTQSQTKLKALEQENSQLAESWEKDAVGNATAAERARLDELKHQDPDKWRQEIAALEDTKRKAFKEQRSKITQEASNLTVLEQREAELVKFNADNPTVQITDDVIKHDIPPRLTASLTNGSITFVEFLEAAKKYVTTPKAIAPIDTPADDPNLGAVPGGSHPSNDAVKKQSASDYSKEVF